MKTFQKLIALVLVAALMGCSPLAQGNRRQPPVPTPPATEPQPEPQIQDLEVIILDMASRPIVGATVTLPDGQVRTSDGSGFVHFPVTGPVIVTATKDGWQPASLDAPPGRHNLHLARAVTAGRRGIVRLCGRAFCDDDGPFPALGFTLMWAHHGIRHTPEQLRANLEWGRQALGADYVRVLGTVGVQPYWSGREIDPRAPDYWDAVVALTNLAYDEYGLRVQWSLFGDAQVMLPNRHDRQQFVETFADTIAKHRLETKIQLVEVANEAWQNGFSGDDGIAQMRDLARRFHDRLARHGFQLPLALSAPEGQANDWPIERTCAEIGAMYAGLAVATVQTPHLSRQVTLVDGHWRHVRQPWEWNACPGPDAAVNNEPLGPGSSVAEEDDPERIAAAYVTSLVSGMAGYVFHADAGVRGRGNLWEHRNAQAIADALRSLRQLLPADLANWARTRHGLRDHPFIGSFGCTAAHCFQIWPDGQPHGVVRAYAATSGDQFIVVPMGVKDHVRLTPAQAVAFDVFDLHGNHLDHYGLRPGESITLSGTRQGYVVRGHYQ